MNKLFDQTFFLQSTKSCGTDIDLEFFTTDEDGFLLDVWFENFTGLVLGEAYIMTVHFSFTGNFANSHYLISFLTCSTIAWKAAGWLTANSAKILRSTAIFCFFIPLMS